jgi:hypothetical protein
MPTYVSRHASTCTAAIRQEGKTVSPVRGPGVDDLGKLPRWLGQIYNLDQPEHYTTLIRVLEDQSRQKRVAMMAPEPPADFVARPAEFDALKKQLLDSKGDSVAITAARCGRVRKDNATLLFPDTHGALRFFDWPKNAARAQTPV